MPDGQHILTRDGALPVYELPDDYQGPAARQLPTPLYLPVDWLMYGKHDVLWVPEEYRYSLIVISDTRFTLPSLKTQCAVIDINLSYLALERQRANAAFVRTVSPLPAGTRLVKKWKSFLKETGLQLTERLMNEAEENDVSFPRDRIIFRLPSTFRETG
jgi:hypothetical protein